MENCFAKQPCIIPVPLVIGFTLLRLLKIAALLADNINAVRKQELQFKINDDRACYVSYDMALCSVKQE